MKAKDIFGLAVRLLGLVFLYFGLRGVIPLLDVDVFNSPDKNEIINDLLPVAFNLAAALWLLSGKLLVRWAYPESSKAPLPPQPRQPTISESTPAPELTGMDRAEKKLAALVEKPKDSHAD